MTKRATYKMVSEDDPSWMQFWNLYPNRKAKKDARKAWFDIDPNPELVEHILSALQWQCEEWVQKDWYTPPYPASWLRAERWTDERTDAQPLATAPAVPKSLHGIQQWMWKKASGV